jgi:hypothetical protein
MERNYTNLFGQIKIVCMAHPSSTNDEFIVHYIRYIFMNMVYLRWYIKECKVKHHTLTNMFSWRELK